GTRSCDAELGPELLGPGRVPRRIDDADAQCERRPEPQPRFHERNACGERCGDRRAQIHELPARDDARVGRGHSTRARRANAGPSITRRAPTAAVWISSCGLTTARPVLSE